MSPSEPNALPPRKLTVQTCKGVYGTCPHNLVEKGVVISLQSALDELKKSYGVPQESGGLHIHDLLQVSISMCPNACARPQIADIGIIGAVIPQMDAGLCSGCNLCVTACKENAMAVADHTPAISKACLFCGLCIAKCNTGALMPSQFGFRIQLGGRLGRHPQLARELPGIYTVEDVCEIIRRGYPLYLSCAKPGWRLTDVITSVGLSWLPENILR